MISSKLAKNTKTDSRGRGVGEVRDVPERSEEEFITEHDWGYARREVTFRGA